MPTINFHTLYWSPNTYLKAENGVAMLRFLACGSWALVFVLSDAGASFLCWYWQCRCLCFPLPERTTHTCASVTPRLTFISSLIIAACYHWACTAHWVTHLSMRRLFTMLGFLGAWSRWNEGKGECSQEACIVWKFKPFGLVTVE